jgi:electron transport complex protein RnfD
MSDSQKFIVSHAPFWHNGSSVSERHFNMIAAALPAVLFGLTQYGGPALAVIAFSVSTAMIWEMLLNAAMKRPQTVTDGHAALIGLVFAMMLPASSPWWLVLTGTFVSVVIGKMIFGGIGGNPFHPALIGMGILLVSWGDYFDFNEALRNYDLGVDMLYPLWSAKFFGPEAVAHFSSCGLLAGQQIGGIGATFGIGLIAGGLYLIARGFVRWEIPASFLAGVFVTAFIFHAAAPDRYAGPLFHLFTGYTLLGAFFLAPEDSSSPVNFIPMLIYGAGAGVLTMLIRNIGVYVDGVVFAVILMNIANPLIDKIRPNAIGKVA